MQTENFKSGSTSSKSTFVVADGGISCTPDGTLTWTTTGESGKLTFTIEQYRWNKWVAIGEVDGLGTEDRINTVLMYLLTQARIKYA